MNFNTSLEHSDSQEVAFLFLTWMVSHAGLLGLSDLVAELVAHLGLAFLAGAKLVILGAS